VNSSGEVWQDGAFVSTTAPAERSAGDAGATASPRVPPRLAGRRPALPNGRAVAGGLLVAAAAVGTFAAWTGADEPPSTRYVVAARPLPVGTVVGADDLEVVAFDAPPALAERSFDTVSVVVGQRTVAPLGAGELVQRSAVVTPEGDDPGRQLSFAVDVADALAGTLEVGEQVDLLATYGTAADDSLTEVVAAGATVAGLPLGDDGARGQTVVLLGLPPDSDVLAVAHAIRQGALTVVRTAGEPLAAGERYRPGAGDGRG
jgi:Flp pilus assembly protein CpaB